MKPISFDDVQISEDRNTAPCHNVEQLAEEVEEKCDPIPQPGDQYKNFFADREKFIQFSSASLEYFIGKTLCFANLKLHMQFIENLSTTNFYFFNQHVHLSVCH